MFRFVCLKIGLSFLIYSVTYLLHVDYACWWMVVLSILCSSSIILYWHQKMSLADLLHNLFPCSGPPHGMGMHAAVNLCVCGQLGFLRFSVCLFVAKLGVGVC